jgi:hypothetical protein
MKPESRDDARLGLALGGVERHARRRAAALANRGTTLPARLQQLQIGFLFTFNTLKE